MCSYENQGEEVMSLSLQPTVQGATPAITLNPIRMILDGALDDITKSMEKMTREVHNASLDVILKAAEQAARLVESLKVAYKDCLDKTCKEVDEVIAKNIDRMTDLARDVVDRNEKALLEVTSRIEDIVRLAPFSNWRLPLLSGMTPRFFAVDSHESATAIRLRFTGNFAFADREACKPEFRLGTRTYAPDSNTTKELQFVLNISKDDPQLNMHSYSLIKGVLIVKWYEGAVQWNPTISEYRTLLGVLPASPGKITVVYTKAEEIIKRTYKSDVVRVDARPHHWEHLKMLREPSPGWQVVLGTRRLDWLEQYGQTSTDLDIDAPDRVQYDIGRKDGGGKIQLVFTECQTIAAQTRKEPKEDLRWGSSWIAEPKEKEVISKILFETFNGDFQEFQPRTDLTNPFIELREFNGTIQIKAIRADKLNEMDVRSLCKKASSGGLGLLSSSTDLKDKSTDKKDDKKEDKSA